MTMMIDGDGKLFSRDPAASGGVRLEIIKSGNNIDRAGCELSNAFMRVVGGANSIKFWTNIWNGKKSVM